MYRCSFNSIVKNLTIIDYLPIHTAAHIFSCRYQWIIDFPNAAYTNIESKKSPTKSFSCSDSQKQVWEPLEDDGNAARRVKPKYAASTLKNKQRCDQYYQHIVQAVNDKATYWHKFNGYYVESDSSCYNNDGSIKVKCVNATELAQAAALNIWEQMNFK